MKSLARGFVRAASWGLAVAAGLFALLPAASADSWQSLAGYITSTPVVGRNKDGRLEIFARGGDNALWHKWQTSPSSTQWSDWASLGGAIVSNAAVVLTQDGRLEVFVVGTDRALYYASQTFPGNSQWSGWEGLHPGELNSDPAAALNADGSLEVFGQGMPESGQVSSSFWDLLSDWVSGPPFTVDQVSASNVFQIDQRFPGLPGNEGWYSWGAVNGGADFTGNVSVVANADGRLEVFARGRSDEPLKNNSVFHSWQYSPDGSWSNWDNLGGNIVAPPVASRNADGKLALFAVGTDYALWQRYQDDAGTYNWSEWMSLNGGLTSIPAVTPDARGRLAVFVRGADNAYWWKSEKFALANSIWGDWEPLGGYFTSAPAVALNTDGSMELFGRGGDGAVWHLRVPSKPEFW